MTDKEDRERADKIGAKAIDIVEAFLQETITRATAQKRIGDLITAALDESELVAAARRVVAFKEGAAISKEWLDGMDEPEIEFTDEYRAVLNTLAALVEGVGK